MNIDNFPSHEMTDPKTGETKQYFGASKYFPYVDPECNDPKSLHYASLYTTYFLVKNKFTQEWEFPTIDMYVGETFRNAKDKLIDELILDSQNVKVMYDGAQPAIHTIRPLSEVEKQHDFDKTLKGVRTYYFKANHWRGLPEFKLDGRYDDYAWVPKIKFHEYMARDYFEVFADIAQNRN